MKKLLSLIALISFLLGNASMIAAIFKIFGEDALLPVVKDLVSHKVDSILFGDHPPRRSSSYSAMSYGNTIIANERRMQKVAEGGPILSPISEAMSRGPIPRQWR